MNPSSKTDSYQSSSTDLPPTVNMENQTKNIYECDCPFCPLVSRNIHVEDVRITFSADTSKVSYPDEYNDTFALTEDKKVLGECFRTIALIGRNNWKLKVGQQGTSKQFGMLVHIRRLTKRTYSIDFHSPSVEEYVKGS